MSLKEETYVCTLAKYGTVREAAKKLFITAPALSTSIRSLEKSLGVPLFYRLNQGFKPTPMGEKYIERSRQILEIDEKFRDELVRYKNKNKTEISLGMYRLCSLDFKGPLLISLKEQLPDITFQIQTNAGLEQNRLLHEGALDYILLTSSLPSPCKRLHIIDDELVLACPATWPMTKEVRLTKTISLDDIKKEKILLPAEWQSIYPYIRRYFQDNHQNIEAPTTLNNMEIAVQCVAAGIGCCFTLQSYVSAFARIPGIRYYRLKNLGFRVPWYLEYQNDVLSEQQLGILADCLKEGLRAKLKAL